MNYIVYDLEATCWKKKPKDFVNEIIEIGAVKINEQRKIIDTFEAFVRPVVHPILSDFCTELTSIEQSQVADAEGFKEVISNFKNWIIDNGQNNYWLCSWGFYDRKQLEKDCLLHQLPDAWVGQHISIKHQYQRVKGQKRPIGCKSAIKQEGLTFEGTHHRGIDDAKNIAKIFLKYFDDWIFKAE